MNKGDRHALKGLMKKYTSYMKKNKNSLLPKFYAPISQKLFSKCLKKSTVKIK